MSLFFFGSSDIGLPELGSELCPFFNDGEEKFTSFHSLEDSERILFYGPELYNEELYGDPLFQEEFFNEDDRIIQSLPNNIFQQVKDNTHSSTTDSSHYSQSASFSLMSRSGVFSNEDSHDEQETHDSSNNSKLDLFGLQEWECPSWFAVSDDSDQFSYNGSDSPAKPQNDKAELHDEAFSPSRAEPPLEIRNPGLSERNFRTRSQKSRYRIKELLERLNELVPCPKSTRAETLLYIAHFVQKLVAEVTFLERNRMS
eukprot:ctg_846.g180